MNEPMSRRSDGFSIIFERTRSGALENVLLVLSESIENFWRYTEVLGENGFGGSSHVVRQEESGVFREITIVKDEQEFYPFFAGTYSQFYLGQSLTLNTMRESSGEVP